MDNLFKKLFPSKETRRYRKMHRRHRKELIKLAKETGEYDWEWLHQMVILQIKHMHEYYSKGDNVWQVDESRLEIVDQLHHILDLEEELERVQEDACGIELVYKGDELVGLNKPADYSERLERDERRVQELYEEIYGYIGKNIQCWWD